MPPAATSGMPVAAALPSTSRRISFESLSVILVFATLLLAAIIWLPSASAPFFPTKNFVLALGSLLALVAYILARLSRGNLILPPGRVLTALWLPAIAYVLATAFAGGSFGLSPSFSLDSAFFMAVVALLGTLAALVLRRPGQYQLATRVFFVAALFVSGLQVILILLNAVMPSFSAPVLVGSAIDMGIVSSLAVLLSLLSLRLLAPAGGRRVALVALWALSLVLLAFINDQLLWILVALISLGFFIESVMRRRGAVGASDLEGSEVMLESDVSSGAEMARSIVIPITTLVVALIFLVAGNLGSALANAFHFSTVQVTPSWQSTLDIGRQVYRTSAWFGAGPGTFGTEWLKARSAALNSTVFWNLDFTSGIGFIPTAFVTTGIVGILAWLLLFGTFLFAGIRSIVMQSSPDPTIRFALVTTFVTALFLFIAAFVFASGPLPLALLFLSLGLFASVLRFAPGKSQWGILFARSPRLGFVIVFALTLVLLGAIGLAYIASEQYLAASSLASAQVALGSGNLDGAINASGRSVSLAPSAEGYEAQASANLAKLQQIANDSSLTSAAAGAQFQQALAAGISAALSATKIAPNTYQSWVMLGNLYSYVVPLGVDGAYARAKDAYDKAIALNPTSPVLPYLEAELEIANKTTKTAETDLLNAITLKQDYTPAIFLLSQLEVATGNIKEALAAAESAAYFTPQDTSALFQVGVLRAATGNTDGAITALSQAVSLNSQFANARYFLAALYAKKNNFTDAISQLNAIAALSSDNAGIVAPLISALQSGKNPFPANLLSYTPPAQ